MRRAWLFGCALSVAACQSPTAALDKLCTIATEVQADASVPAEKKNERIGARVKSEISHADVKGAWEALQHVSPQDRWRILRGTAQELGYPSFKCPAIQNPPEAQAGAQGSKPRAVMTIVRVEGGVTGTEAVTRAISQTGPAMKACYQKRVEAKGSFEGNLTYRESSGDAGMVAFEVETDALNDAETRACVTEITRGWKIPTASKPEDQMIFELQFRVP
jgi:hypothetical protein